MLIIYKFIDNIHQTYIDKFLICKFLKNFKIIILSIVSSLIFLVKHDEHFYIARIYKYLPLYTSVITGLHPSYSNQTDNVRARMKRRRKGKKERKKRFPWSRAVVLRWAQRSSRTWRTRIGHYEIVSGVPASRRAVVVPTCHRIAAQSSVGATRLARGSIAIALPCPLGHAPLIRLCCPLLLHSYTIISSRGLPLLPPYR